MVLRGWRDRVVYTAVWAACFAPILFYVYQGFTDGLGANPIEYLIRQLGVWALRLLILSLAVSPFARLIRQPRLIGYRRTIGLWAFAYVCLHLTTYVAIDHVFDWPTIGKDIIKRPYITIGMGAFTLLIPLAVTSTDRLLRRMGPKRWRRLHQLIYLIAPMGVLHYYLLVKADHRPPLVYGAIVLLLLAYRLAAFLAKRPRPPEARPAPASA
jgi:sulfoxide reductase heme-binding subunit YedZ